MLATVITTAVAGCRPAPPASTLALGVEYAGCRRVLAGPVCLIAKETVLTLWIETDVDAALTVTVDGTVADADLEEATPRGRRARVTVGPEARRLAVTAIKDGTQSGPGSHWHLDLDAADEPTWRVQVREAMRTNELDRVHELATEALEATPSMPGMALSILARIHLARGDLEAAEDAFRRAIAAHQEYGALSDQTSDAAALSYLLAYRRHDLEAARAVLEAMPDAWNGPAESVYDRAYYRGLLAVLTGDLRTALRILDEVVDVARRLDLKRQRLASEQLLLRQLQNLGRGQDAAALVDRLLDGGDEVHACQRGELLNNLGWTAILALETKPTKSEKANAFDDPTLDDPTSILEEAAQTFAEGCPQLAHERINVRINLALAHLHAGRTTEAAAELTALDEREAIPESRMMLWKLDAEARLALAEDRPDDAIARYDEMAALATAALAPAAEWRATLGRGRALESSGRTDDALAAYDRAEGQLDDALRRVPLTEGRELFLTRRQEGIRRYLDLLLQAGLGEQAFAVARRSRSRILRGVLHQERLEHLAPDEQRRWDRAVSAYHRDRERLDIDAGGDWRLSRPRLERLQAERREAHRDLLRQLDDALAIIDRRGPNPDRLSPPRTGELLLLFHPTAMGWVGFAHDSRQLSVQRLPCEDVERPAAELAQCVLEPFAELIDRTETLRILPYGPLRQIDFHALPWHGAPLLASASVIYGLDLPNERQPSTTADSPRTALLIADAAGDLPAARREAETVATTLSAAPASWSVRQLNGVEARGDAVRSLLPRVDLLHYAGHAAFADGGWDSALRLAASGQLTVGDVLLLERVPRWVVLSGCETGRSTDAAASEAIGLAHAFVTAGADSVVATGRPVSDSDARRLSQAFYRLWTDGMPPAAALRRAQLDLRDTDPASDWAAFRLLQP